MKLKKICLCRHATGGEHRKRKTIGPFHKMTLKTYVFVQNSVISEGNESLILGPFTLSVSDSVAEK